MRTALTSAKFWLTLSAAAVFGAGIVGRVLAATTLQIVSPSSNQIIEGTTVAVSIDTKGIKLVDPKTYTRNGYNQGHLHLWLDQQDLTKTSAIKIATNEYTFENVKYGDHVLVAEVVNNDHSSLNPKVLTTVNFETMAPVAVKSNSALLVSIAAFLFLCITLYFVYPKSKAKLVTHTSPKKSSHKSAKRK